MPAGTPNTRLSFGALRGLKDTSVPLLFAAIGYWGIGFPICCWLGFWTPLGAVGVWIGLSVGTLVYAALLVMRFQVLAGRLPFAEATPPAR